MTVGGAPRIAVLGMLAGGAWLLAVATTGGCSDDQACLRWSASDGECPGPDQALQRFQAACGAVIDVLGPGTFDEDACCYPVEEADSDAPIACDGSSGPVPSGSGATGVSGTGAGPPCGGTIAGECGACAEAGCCAELITCTSDPGCVDCINDPAVVGSPSATCAVVDSTSARRSDALTGCIAAAQCPGDPCLVNPQPPPNCDPPIPAPSDGACAAGLGCNPITSEGCDTAAGEVCDLAGGGTFACAPQGYANLVCSGCGATRWCGVGGTCYGALCARFCCDDGDCGTGECSFEALGTSSSPVGICVQPSGAPTSGAGGALVGGAAGTGGTGPGGGAPAGSGGAGASR
jgi:hypothetical protein